MALEKTSDELKKRVSELEAELDSVRQELHAAREKQRRGDEVFRRFSDSGLIGIALFELSGKVRFGNEAFMNMIGRSAEEIAAGAVRWEELASPEWRSRATEALEEVKRRGSSAPYEAECSRPDGTRFLGLFTTVATDGEQAAAFVLDVTDRKRSEARLAFLAEASRILASSLDYQTTLDQVARLTVPLLADWCDIQVLDEAGAIRRVAVVHSDPAKVALAYELDRRYPVDPESPRGVPHVIRSGEPEIYREIPDELLVAGARDAEHLRLIRELGLRSALVVPLHPQAGTRRGRTLGAITLVYAESGRRYTEEEIALAEDLARRAGMAVDNARLYSEAQAAIHRHQTVEAKLTLLTEATGALTASLQIDRVLAEILRLSRRLVAADAYAIWRLAPASGSPAAARWSIAAAEGLSSEYQSAAVQALRHSQPAPNTPVVVGDIDQEPLLAQHRHLLQQEGICSMLVSPLQTHGRVPGEAGCSGTLVFYYRQPHQFDEIERKVASALANLAASAIATSELYEAANQRAEQLVEADQLKDQFLAMLAHELRNPLGAITNAVYVLRRVQERGPAADDRSTDQRAREIVERQSRHMARLVDQLLDVSRVSRGKIEIHPQRLELTQLLRDTVEDHRPTLEAAGLSLTLELPDHRLRMEGDPTRLQQAVGNLLQNAAKFTPPGGQVTVRLAVWSEGARGRGGEGATGRAVDVAVPGADSTSSPPRPLAPSSPRPLAVITVRDTGIGVAPELLPRLFDPFVQADRSLDRSRGGLGLGLALVKAIVELHGGMVAAESEGPGRGATFTLTLPILDFGFWISDSADKDVADRKPSSLSDHPKSKIQNPKSPRVLVIEDNADAAETLRDLLELLGHPVEIALSGPDGVEKARQLGPDVVLCDLGLPGMDGYAVAAALRQDPATAGARLVALTGYGQDEDLRRSTEAGFDAHLTKPVSLDDLKRHLAGNPEP